MQDRPLGGTFAGLEIPSKRLQSPSGWREISSKCGEFTPACLEIHLEWLRIPFGCLEITSKWLQIHFEWLEIHFR